MMELPSSDGAYTHCAVDSLSPLMRHRWYENRAECALTTSLAQDSLLDNYFWDYIEESCWGENAVGGHKGRLELLKDPCRMLMGWFVPLWIKFWGK